MDVTNVVDKNIVYSKFVTTKEWQYFQYNLVLPRWSSLSLSNAMLTIVFSSHNTKNNTKHKNTIKTKQQKKEQIIWYLFLLEYIESLPYLQPFKQSVTKWDGDVQWVRVCMLRHKKV